MAFCRPADPEDIPAIAALGESLYHELHYSNWVEYKTQDVIKTLSALHEHGVLLVAEDDELIGYIGVAIHPMYLNQDVLAAEEIFWWVHEAYRALGIGEELLTKAQVAAQDRGVKFMSSMLNENAHRRGVSKLLESHGYELAERTYFKVF